MLAWFDEHGRKDLPWQKNPTPYHIWLSEIMLQQTQVATVIAYYTNFIAIFPTVYRLASASVDDVLAVWTGLGYYARARNLHKTAGIIVSEYRGELPATLAQLTALPGIGRSTAGAIMSLAYEQRYAILDGNVKRVLARYYAIKGWPGNKKIENQLWQHAEKLLPKKRIANYIQAQMDLGATLCTHTKPHCTHCPLQADCCAFQHNIAQHYPFARPKKILPVRQINWLIALLPTGKILLERRPNNGIWGGLWSFPECSAGDDIKRLCIDMLAVNVNSVTPQRNINHTFTHFKLNIHPYIIRCTINSDHISENKNAIWYTISFALLLGLPAPVKSFLQLLQKRGNNGTRRLLC